MFLFGNDETREQRGIFRINGSTETTLTESQQYETHNMLIGGNPISDIEARKGGTPSHSPNKIIGSPDGSADRTMETTMLSLDGSVDGVSDIDPNTPDMSPEREVKGVLSFSSATSGLGNHIQTRQTRPLAKKEGALERVRRERAAMEKRLAERLKNLASSDTASRQDGYSLADETLSVVTDTQSVQFKDQMKILQANYNKDKERFRQETELLARKVDSQREELDRIAQEHMTAIIDEYEKKQKLIDAMEQMKSNHQLSLSQSQQEKEALHRKIMAQQLKIERLEEQQVKDMDMMIEQEQILQAEKAALESRAEQLGRGLLVVGDNGDVSSQLLQMQQKMEQMEQQYKKALRDEHAAIEKREEEMSRTLAAKGKLMSECFNLKKTLREKEAEYKTAIEAEHAATLKREEEMSRTLEAKGKLSSELFNLKQSSKKREATLKSALKWEQAALAKREEEMTRTLDAKGNLSSELFSVRQTLAEREAELQKELRKERASVAKREEEMSRTLAAKGKLMSDLFNLKQAYSKMEAEYKKTLEEERAATAKREEEMSRTLEAKGKLSSKLFNLERAFNNQEAEHKKALAEEIAKREKREEEMSAALVAKGKLSSELFNLKQSSQKREAELLGSLEKEKAALAKREEEMSRTLQAKGKLMSELFNLKQSSSKQAAEDAQALQAARATIAKREEEMSRTLEAKGKLSSKLFNLQQSMRKMEEEYEVSVNSEKAKVAFLTKQLEEGEASHTAQVNKFNKEIDELGTRLSERDEKIQELEAELKVISMVYRERIHHLETEIVELKEHHSSQLLRIEHENKLLKQELLDLDGNLGKEIIEKHSRDRFAETDSQVTGGSNDAEYTELLRSKEEELNSLIRQMDDLKAAHKSEIATLKQTRRDNFAETLEKHKTLEAEFKNLEQHRNDLRRGCKMQQDEIALLRQQQHRQTGPQQGDETGQLQMMQAQLSAQNLIQERILMAEQAQTKRLSLQLDDAEKIRKAEARAAQAENESLIQQLSDINERVKELNKTLAEKDAKVDELRRGHELAMSEKVQENEELTNKLKSLTEQSCDLSFTKQRLVEEKEELETKVLAMEGEVRATKFLNEMFLGQRDRVEASLKKLQEEFDASQAEKERLAGDNEDLKTQVKALQDALRAQQSLR